MLVKRIARGLAPLLAALLAACAASAEVVDAGDTGFSVKVVQTGAARAYAAAAAVGKWWDPAHTYSGDAANLSIDARPQGCWCEKLPGGGVRHMTVVFASPGKILRFEGGLGPLQSMGVSGVMTWTFQTAGEATTVELTYVIGGYSRGGFKEISAGVDAVLRGQIERYRRYVDTGKP
jgi:uncharacterized protein YndB with AHSA1/START domain